VIMTENFAILTHPADRGSSIIRVSQMATETEFANLKGR
jgi:hypothetical protein